MKAAGIAVLLTVVASAQTPRDARQPMALAGRPFPRVERYAASFSAPLRTISVDAPAKLQEALCALAPGERLRVAKGTYGGDYAIDGHCRDGTRERPVQLFFDEGATLTGRLTIRRSHWQISGGAAGGVEIAASSVSLDKTRMSGLRIGKASDVIVSNSVIARGGVEIDGGTGIVLTNNRLLQSSVQVRSGRNLRLTANTIREGGATAILAERVSGLRIENNTLQETPGRGNTRAIDLRQVEDAVIHGNHIAGHSVGIAVGRIDAAVQAARNITIDHNHFESLAERDTGVAIEAGSGIRFVNNVVNGYADAILLLGKRPSLGAVTVANNLVLDVSRTAFAIRDRAAAALFDFNVFSPRAESVEVEVEGATSTLAAYLAKGSMPRTAAARVMILNRDLARLGGIETIDRGTAVSGLAFAGKAPDLGVAER